MSHAATFNDIRKIFQEITAQMKETDRRFQEMVLEDRERRAELDRKFREMREETDHQIQEVSRQMKETDRRLGGRLGEFVEGLVAPACETLFAQWGIPVHKVSRRVKAKLPEGRLMEIDLFVVNTDAVALVEVKSKLDVSDVREHLDHMGDFKEFFPEYADKRAFGAVAAMVIEDNVRRFAINQGLFVIEQAGDTLRMANPDDFVPKSW